MNRWAVDGDRRCVLAAVIVGMVCLAALLGGCGVVGDSVFGKDPSPEGSWLYGDTTAVLFVQLSQSGDTFGGSVQGATRPATGEQFEAQSAPVTATRHGTRLSLSLGSGVAAMQANIHGQTLTVEAALDDGTIHSYDLHRASIDDYNAAMATLRAAMAPLQKGDAEAADSTSSAATCSVAGEYFTSTGTFTNTSGHQQGFTFRVSWVYQPDGLDKTSYPVVSTGLLGPGESYSWNERVASAFSYTLPLRCDVVEVEYAG
jgi:hypothetical protein